MNKKPYKAPEVRKVRLTVKNAVLAACRLSPALDYEGSVMPCAAGTTGACFGPA